jgi:hypothetical protein
MRSLEVVHFYPDCSRDFLGDVVLTGKNSPKCRSPLGANNYVIVGGNPKLTLLRLHEDLLHYKQDAFTQFNGVCFDGGFTLVKVYFNTVLSMKLKEINMTAGCTIEITKHQFIWRHTGSSGEPKAVMLINGFDHKHGPVHKERPDDCAMATPDYDTANFHSPAINGCYNDGVISFMQSYQEADSSQLYWASMIAF